MIKTISIWGAILYSITTYDAFPLEVKKNDIALTFKKKEDFFKEIRNTWCVFQTTLKDSEKIFSPTAAPQDRTASKKLLHISEFFLKECS